MCGRFSLGLPREEVQNVVHVRRWRDPGRFVPRYNIAPRTYAPVLLREQNESDKESECEVVLHTMRWGVVPHWSKHEDKTLSTTNARCENLVEGGGMWGTIKGRKRCAVVCQGYYEWLKKGRDRLPHFTKHENGRIMLLAGLYDCVVLEGTTEPLYTFTIVTTAASKEFSWLHDRQPVILSNEKDLGTWLDTSTGKWTLDLTKIVEPYHDSSSPLACYPVPKEVGKVGTESPTYIEPITQRKDGIQAMFARQKAVNSNLSSQPSTSSEAPQKRKRSSSSIVIDDSNDPQTNGKFTPLDSERSKRPKVEEKGNIDGDVCEHQTAAPSNATAQGSREGEFSKQAPTKKAKMQAKRSKSETSSKSTSPSSSPTKITNFFTKTSSR